MGTAHGVETTPKSKPQQEGSDIALLLHPEPGRDGQVPLETPSRWSPMSRQTPATTYFQKAPDVPEHPAHQSGDEAQGRERHGQAEDEEEREDERAPDGRRLLVPGDDAHQERDHGQDAGIEGRGHAAQEDGDDRQPGVVLEERGDVAEKALHRRLSSVDAVLLQELEDLLLGEEPDVAEDLVALLVDEDLGRDELDAVFRGPARVFPDVVEDDLDPVGVGLRRSPS